MAMADEKLQIKITAIDKTKQAFNSIANKLGGLKKAAGAVGIAVGAIGAAFVAAAKKTIDFADEIAKTADMVGLSTSALQELRVATDLAGISQSQLDTALGALSKRLGEFRVGTGALKTFLDKADPSFGQLLQSTTSNEEAFRLIIARLSEYTNAQDRAALSAAAFGRSAGVALSKLSTEALEDGIRKARELGLVIDENLLRKSEDIKDQFSLATRVIQTAFMKQILRIMKEVDISKLAEDVSKIAQKFIEASTAAFKFIGIIDRPKAEKIERLKAKIDDLATSFKQAAERAKELSGTSMGRQAEKQMALIAKQIKEANSQLAKLEGTADEFKIVIDKPTILPMEGASTVISQADDIDKKMREMAESFRLPKTPLEELEEQSRDTFGNMQDIGVRTMNKLEDSIIGVMDGTKSLKDAFSDMAQSILSDLIRMQIQESITGPLSGFLSKGLSSLFGGGGGGFASGFAGAPALGFADGGVTSSRRPYLVGERGPEMFVPNMTGRVVPTKSLGGGEVTVNVINNTGAQTRTEETQGPNGAKSIDIIIDESVARNIGSPGSRTTRALRNSFSGLNPQLAGR
jgi:predicted transcriptional regulator